MAGERLRDYELDLCDYVLGHFRGPLRTLPRRPKGVPELSYPEWHCLDLPTWLGRTVAGLTEQLADHVWASVVGEAAERPLTDAELSALELAADGPPMRVADECVWEPYDGLHRRSVACVAEIRAGLTRQTAEEWAEDSAGFAARLCEDGLPLTEGIATVRQWAGRVRRLLQAMGAKTPRPAPIGVPPTPAPPAPTRQLPRRVEPSRRDADAPGQVGTMPSDMLSPAQVARRFTVSRSTVYAACQAGLLAHYRVPSKRGTRGKYLIQKGVVQAWLESLRVAPASTTPSASAPASSGSPASPFSVLDPDRLAKAWKSR